MYEYRAVVDSIWDGDTVHLDVDLGFSTWVRGDRYRLSGINAPELSTPEGQAAKAYIETLLLPGDLVVIQTTKDRKDNYGRLLVRILTAAGVDVNQAMLASGHAVAYP